jgi:nicotinamidase-related amidase
MQTALLVIDMQNFFYDMCNPAHDPEHHERQFIPEITKLVGVLLKGLLHLRAI